MSHQQSCDQLTDTLAKFTAFFGKYLPDDVLKRIKELSEEQTNELSKIVYNTIFENQRAAAEDNVPFCQDTGVIHYYVMCGAKFPYLGDLAECLRKAVIRATTEAPLRHNAVQVFDEVNTRNNTGDKIPWIDWEIIPDSDECTIYAYMAGGGCSLPGAAKVLMPSEGYEGAIRFIFDILCNRGINACPPLLVGVGIAGSMDVAARLSKRAMMRDVGSHSTNERGAEFERQIEEGINRIGIGPSGMLGTKSVLGVNVEHAARHPSAIAVAVSTGCWGHRRASIRIKADLSYEMLSHKGVRL